jgi:hypothetical protein
VHIQFELAHMNKCTLLNNVMVGGPLGEATRCSYGNMGSLDSKVPRFNIEYGFPQHIPKQSMCQLRFHGVQKLYTWLST